VESAISSLQNDRFKLLAIFSARLRDLSVHSSGTPDNAPKVGTKIL